MTAENTHAGDEGITQQKKRWLCIYKVAGALLPSSSTRILKLTRPAPSEFYTIPSMASLELVILKLRKYKELTGLAIAILVDKSHVSSRPFDYYLDWQGTDAKHVGI